MVSVHAHRNELLPDKAKLVTLLKVDLWRHTFRNGLCSMRNLSESKI